MVLSQAKENTRFLEIPQDSHIVGLNKEDSYQTVHMRLFNLGTLMFASYA